MRDDEALLAAIVAHPDEDTPRLAYADWLDEHRPDTRPSPAQGPSARAELIRVQCRLATLTPAADDFTELLDRQSELGAWLDAHDLYEHKLPAQFRADEDAHAEFHRGFPRRAWLELYAGSGDPRRVAAHIAALLKCSPVRELRAVFYDPALPPPLVRLPVIERLRGLSFQVFDDCTAELARALAESPHVRNLRWLRLINPLTAADAERLAGAPHLGALESFEVQLEPGESADAVRALGCAPWFRALRHLWIGGRLPNAALVALCELPPFPNLRALQLSDNRFTAPGVAALVRSKAFPHLAHLDLSRNESFNADGAHELVRAKHWQLGHLELRACALASEGGAALAAWSGLRNVRVLDIAANRIGAPGAEALAASRNLGALRHLDCAHNPLGARGLVALAESRALRHLTRLNVSSTAQGANRGANEKALTKFAARLALPHLRHLNLSEQPLGAEGAAALAANPALANLRFLDLRDGRIDDAGLKALAESPHLGELLEVEFVNNDLKRGAAVLEPATVWPRLVKCNLYGNRVPLEVARRVVAARPVVEAFVE